MTSITRSFKLVCYAQSQKTIRASAYIKAYIVTVESYQYSGVHCISLFCSNLIHRSKNKFQNSNLHEMQSKKTEIVKPGLIFWTIIVLTLLGGYFFTFGFFLMKEQIETESTFNPVNSKVAWFEPQTKRVIHLVLDALKFEFLIPHKNCNQDTEHHRNNFPFLHSLIENEPNNTVVLELYSDPPTVTQQRIKSILVGNIPPFIDITKNFGTYRVSF